MSQPELKALRDRVRCLEDELTQRVRSFMNFAKRRHVYLASSQSTQTPVIRPHTPPDHEPLTNSEPYHHNDGWGSSCPSDDEAPNKAGKYCRTDSSFLSNRTEIEPSKALPYNELMRRLLQVSAENAKLKSQSADLQERVGEVRKQQEGRESGHLAELENILEETERIQAAFLQAQKELQHARNKQEEANREIYRLQGCCYQLEAQCDKMKRLWSEERTRLESNNIALECQLKIANSEKFGYEASYLMMKQKTHKLQTQNTALIEQKIELSYQKEKCLSEISHSLYQILCKAPGYEWHSVPKTEKEILQSVAAISQLIQNLLP